MFTDPTEQHRERPEFLSHFWMIVAEFVSAFSHLAYCTEI